MALGVCDKMMRITGQYTSEREQFGRAIATFQAVSHRVADCYIDVECLRLVTQQAASLIDQGRPAEDAVLMAKIWCGNVAHRVSQASQHCHGGTGVDRDYPLFRYCELGAPDRTDRRQQRPAHRRTGPGYLRRVPGKSQLVFEVRVKMSGSGLLF